MSKTEKVVLVRILKDFGDELTPAVDADTQVVAWINPVDKSAWYNHPLTDEEWLSLEGDYEVIE